MLHQVTQVYSGIDTSRLYCTGMSDGGTFSYILMQSIGQIFAGMAAAAAFPVPSMMSADDFQKLKSLGVPILHVHGTNDWMFPIEQVREGDQKARAGAGGSGGREPTSMLRISTTRTAFP